MERQSSSKEQIRQLLRDAICVLCKNVIAHTVQMKIEALIGITIDSEADVVLININEMFDKSISDRNAVVNDSKLDSSACDADIADVVKVEDCEIHDNSYASHSVVVQEPSSALTTYQSGKKSKSRFVVKTEQSSSFIAESSAYKSPEYGQPYADYSQLKLSQMGHCNLNTNMRVETDNSSYDEACGSQLGMSGETDWQHYEDDLDASDYANASLSNDYTESYEQFGDETQYNQCMPEFGTAPKRQRVSNKSNFTQKRPRGKPDNHAVGSGVSEENNWKDLDEDEVSHVTLYTCSRCGIQLKNKQSFKRHKKSHEGIVYRCDGCGKILSRSDHLNAHRRKCAAALQQEPLDNLYSV